MTFDPASPRGNTPEAIDRPNFLGAVACPSDVLCVAVDAVGNEVTFAPGSSPNANAVDQSNFLDTVACASISQCTAVDLAGAEVTFNPSAVQGTTPIVIDAGTNVTSVACPSTSQCSAVDPLGRVVTFDPGSPGTSITVRIAGANALIAIACTSGSSCAAVDAVGNAFVGSDLSLPTPPAPSVPPANTPPPTIPGRTAPLVKPANGALPVIIGTPTAGHSLSVSTGTWSGTPPISFGEQWQRCRPGCSNIAGATRSTYKLAAADRGARVRVVVSATNAAGSGQATSDEVGCHSPR